MTEYEQTLIRLRDLDRMILAKQEDLRVKAQALENLYLEREQLNRKYLDLMQSIRESHDTLDRDK